MRMHFMLVFLAGFALLSASCVESTEPTSPRIVAYQVPGCNQSPGKLSAADSCFFYRFRDVLYVDFCATGNCCPDSNRFAIAGELRNDTILVTIADTAAHLCRCMCPYLLHFELPDLPLPSYMFVCQRQDYSSRLIVYAERVYREMH